MLDKKKSSPYTFHCIWRSILYFNMHSCYIHRYYMWSEILTWMDTAMLYVESEASCTYRLSLSLVSVCQPWIAILIQQDYNCFYTGFICFKLIPFLNEQKSSANTLDTLTYCTLLLKRMRYMSLKLVPSYITLQLDNSLRFVSWSSGRSCQPVRPDLMILQEAAAGDDVLLYEAAVAYRIMSYRALFYAQLCAQLRYSGCQVLLIFPVN